LEFGKARPLAVGEGRSLAETTSPVTEAAGGDEATQYKWGNSKELEDCANHMGVPSQRSGSLLERKRKNQRSVILKGRRNVRKRVEQICALGGRTQKRVLNQELAFIYRQRGVWERQTDCQKGVLLEEGERGIVPHEVYRVAAGVKLHGDAD